MVYKKIDRKMIEKICKRLEFYDKYKRFPEEKVRIDVTISQEALNKLAGKNKSKLINYLILKVKSLDF